MLREPNRHELVQSVLWDEGHARATIADIVSDTEAHFSEGAHRRVHPHDADNGETQPLYPLYFGACGVFWALHYLQKIGACNLRRSYARFVEPLMKLNREWLASFPSAEFSSYMMGDTGILLLCLTPDDHTLRRLEDRIAANVHNPTRELMWGSPGTLLAALFLHRRNGQTRWADLFRTSSRVFRSQLTWSPEFKCHYWTQNMYGRQSTYLDAVHGFVATASPLIRGRALLHDEECK